MRLVLIAVGVILLGLGSLTACNPFVSAPTPLATVNTLPTAGPVILDLVTVKDNPMGDGAYGLALYLVDPTSGAMQRWAVARPLEFPKSACGPYLRGASWSTTRRQLLIGGDFDCQPALFTIGPDGQTTDLALRAANPEQPREWMDFAWSPDGTRVAYNWHGWTSTEDVDAVYVQEATGSEPVQISHQTGGHSPAWSPDGAALAFSTFYEAATIYRVDADGANPRPLTSTFKGANRPAWSPDGQTIAFVGLVDGQTYWNLWRMDADGGHLQAVLPLGTALDGDAKGVSVFAWAPDGQRFVVLSDHAGPCTHNAIEGGNNCTSSLYLVNSDGTGLARLGTRTQSSHNARLFWLP